VCRQGGDEFLVLLVDITDRAVVVTVAERIVQSLCAPVDLAGVQVQVGCSIGISLYPSDGDDFEVLLNRADQALYRVKHEGRAGYRFFTSDQDQGNGEPS
jgi:diguanylate cyclase (GGDEF)-like protein